MMLEFVRTLYQRNKTSHFCTLRSDMLMTFHDCKRQDIYKQDPCHDFAFYIQYAGYNHRGYLWNPWYCPDEVNFCLPFF